MDILPAPVARITQRAALPAPYLWRLPEHPRPRRAYQASGLPLPCQSSGSAPRCSTPTQLAQGYDVTPLLLSGIDGRGQSIVILSGSPDPSLSSDLHAFDQAFNLLFSIIKESPT